MRIGLTDAALLFAPSVYLFMKIKAHHHAELLSCVFVDEAQFLRATQVSAFSDVVDVLDIPVLTFGLRSDFRGHLFTSNAALLAWAVDIQKVKTIRLCGRKATMDARPDRDSKVLEQGEQMMIGGNERYLLLCRRHWKQSLGQLPTSPKISSVAAD